MASREPPLIPGGPPAAGFQIPNSVYAEAYAQQPGYPQSGFQGFATPDPRFESGQYESYPNADYMGGGFEDKVVRRGFIRKVYGILMCQLLVTLVIMTVFVYHEPTRLFARQNSFLSWVAFGVLILLMLILNVCGDIHRRFPANFIFLALFTVVLGFDLGFMVVYYHSNEVLMAVGITAAVCLTLTLFAFQTKWDFTILRGVLMVCLVIFFLFGLIALLVQVEIFSLIYSCIGALLFSVYLIYDTQLMMGGKHKYSLGPEEYFFASLNLYLDVINIFSMILGIMGSSRD